MTHSDTRPEAGIDWRIGLYLLLLAALPLFGVQFGVGNQIEQFPIIERLRDPGFAMGDFFLDSASAVGQPRYYYSALMAALTTLAPLYMVVHVMMVLSGFVLGVASYVAGRRLLGAGETGAAFGATLVLLNYGISIGFAGYLVFSNFQPASIAISTAIAGVTALALGRIWLATALFLFAAIMHPTLGSEVAILGYAAVFLTSFSARSPIRPLPLFAAGMVFLAGLSLFWALPNMGGGGDRLSDADFFAILAEFRAPHHYLGLGFPTRRWLEAGLFVAATFWIAGMAWRAGVDRRNVTLLGLLIVLVMVLCLASLYFVDIAESRIWVTAQVFRMVLVAKWAGYLLIGWMVGRWLTNPQPADVVLAALILLPSANAQPYALVAVLVTRVAITARGLTGWFGLVATLPAIFVAAYHHHRYGADDEFIRLVVAGLALAALARLPRRRGAMAAAAIILGFLALVIHASGQGPLARPDFQSALTLEESAQDSTQIALMARDIGPKDALWLVPPRMENFRYVAGHPVVADFTSIPFEDTGLIEWRARMTDLFGDTTRSGHGASREMTDRYRSDPPVALAAQKYGARYAVLFAETPWDGDVLAVAGDYKVVQIAP
ncbi:MAG: DUF6798 domain-containing protein [Marinibacterium sp.]